MSDDKTQHVSQLHPNEIIRRGKGRKYFGLSDTQIDEKVKTGEIPAPIPLSDTGRASGWTGQMIIDHHRQLREKAEARRAKAEADRVGKSKRKTVAA